jgi:hypothetical protein
VANRDYKASIIRALAANGAMTTVELAADVGASLAYTGKLARELREEGLVEAGSRRLGLPGRPRAWRLRTGASLIQSAA